MFSPRIMSIFEDTQPGSGDETQLTVVISTLFDEQRLLAYQLDGKRYDCGSKLGYLKATVEYGLHHAELAEYFRNYLINQDAKID